jgi:PRTRC genetic system protein B
MQVTRNDRFHQQNESAPVMALVFSATSSAMSDLTGITRHPITGGRLGFGEPVSMQMMSELLADLTESSGHTKKSSRQEIQFIPSNVLLSNEESILWYQPSREAMLWLQTGGERRGIKIRWPALLFRANKTPTKLSVVALDSDMRPTLESDVFDVPMPNCYHGGGFCLGSATMPRQLDLSSLPKIELCVYDALKTHSNNSKAIADGTTPTAYWLAQENDRHHSGHIPSITSNQMTKLGTIEQWLSGLASR